jgi:polyhydroxyalkanoate synthesis regulator phasin
MLAGQQTRYNEYVLRVLSTLVKDLEVGPDPSDLKALREEVAQLRAHVARLEAEAANTRS